MTVVRNGRMLDIRNHRAPLADLLIAAQAQAQDGGRIASSELRGTANQVANTPEI
jgi:hypothetical protein